MAIRPVRGSRVTALDKFLGPPNIEVSGLPVQGRSGGGLFSEDGLLIGVCNAADPADNEGLYAALAVVHDELDRARLSYVYRSGGQSPAAEASLVAVQPPSMPKSMPRPVSLVAFTDQAGNPPAAGANQDSAVPPRPLSGEEQAALEEIRRHASEGAEVICIIRSRSNPQAQSEIFVLDKVSPALLEQLAAEVRTGNPNLRRLTSLQLPRDGQASRKAAVAAQERPMNDFRIPEGDRPIFPAQQLGRSPSCYSAAADQPSGGRRALLEYRSDPTGGTQAQACPCRQLR